MNANLGQDPKRIKGTLALLRHFRAFLKSDSARMVDPTTGWHRVELDKREARQRLTWLVDVAIGRKAGADPTACDCAGCKEHVEIIRDSDTLRCWSERRQLGQFVNRNPRTEHGFSSTVVRSGLPNIDRAIAQAVRDRSEEW